MVNPLQDSANQPLVSHRQINFLRLVSLPPLHLALQHQPLGSVHLPLQEASVPHSPRLVQAQARLVPPPFRRACLGA